MTTTERTASPDQIATRHDVIVIGAGFAGIYAVHKLRDQLGLDVRAFDAAGGVGGTWYWNRYPGARVDIAGVHYSYSFDEELQQQWHWTERYPSQPEILSYLEYVADRYDIRRSVTFDTRITRVDWDDDADLWVVSTDRGTRHSARFLVSGSGTLSVPKAPEIRGIESFSGRTLVTANWREDMDLSGKRVGVIGTGASGIQVITEVAKVAKSLTVFQRTPNYATPINNYPTDPQEEAAEKAAYAELRSASRNHMFGLPYSEVQPSALTVTAEERRAVYDDRWARGGFRLIMDSFADLLLDQAANDTVSEYIRDRIRDRVSDPATAELLTPTTYPYGTKRPPLENSYYETFNRDSVSLVDVSANPIDSAVPQGIRLADGTVHELDVLILAMGFDALTGPLLSLNVTGRGGVRLVDAWKEGPETYLGLTSSGFPNMFMITGPQSPAVVYTVPLAIEDHVDFIADMITYMDEHGHYLFEATEQAQSQWDAETTAIGNATLIAQSNNSWFVGANVPGKPRKVLLYLGGVPRYRAICANVQNNDYRGFRFAGTSSDLDTSSHAPALDPSVMFLDEMLAQQGVAGLRDIGIEGARSLANSFLDMQAPRQQMARVTEHRYGPEAEQVLRVYVPEEQVGAPVLVFFHGGGFVSGGLEVAEEPARDLAARTGAIVVSATYRLAPEHRFPAAHDDADAALRWTFDNIADHGGDPSRITVAGESAGGSLAASAVAHSHRDGRPLSALVLINPWVNPTITTPSLAEYADGPLVRRDDLLWFIEQYTSGPGDTLDTRLALDLSELSELSALPLTLILTNECDPLRDEAELLAKSMHDAGVDVEQQRFPGLAHGVFSLSLAVARSSEQRAAVANFLTHHLDPSRADNAKASR
nr:alpha/beta hydrolase fold domain-containing protein [Rhodococcus wratislaviensis]